MLGDVHGMDPSQPMPAGELLIDYTGEGGPNPAYGFLVPVVEGKESLAIEFVKGHGGAGAEAFAASRARIGVNRERVWVYGGGKMLLVVWESAELDQVMPRWVASEDPGDAAFLKSVKEFSGNRLQGRRTRRHPTSWCSTGRPRSSRFGRWGGFAAPPFALQADCLRAALTGGAAVSWLGVYFGFVAAATLLLLFTPVNSIHDEELDYGDRSPSGRSRCSTSPATAGSWLNRRGRASCKWFGATGTAFFCMSTMPARC